MVTSRAPSLVSIMVLLLTYNHLFIGHTHENMIELGMPCLPGEYMWIWSIFMDIVDYTCIKEIIAILHHIF